MHYRRRHSAHDGSVPVQQLAAVDRTKPSLSEQVAAAKPGRRAVYRMAPVPQPDQEAATAYAARLSRKLPYYTFYVLGGLVVLISDAVLAGGLAGRIGVIAAAVFAVLLGPFLLFMLRARHWMKRYGEPGSNAAQ